VLNERPRQTLGYNIPKKHLIHYYLTTNFCVSNLKPPNERKLGQIGTITPQQKWNTHEIDIFASSDEAESGNAGEQLARNSLMNGNDYEQILFKTRS
jgi:hypothetical protein